MSCKRLFWLCALVLVPAAAAAGRSETAPRTGELASARAAVHPLPFYYDLYAFRGLDGGTDIVTAFAVEAGRLRTEPAHDRRRYRFSVSLALADPAVGSVSNTHDTVHVEVSGRMPDDHLLYTHVEVPASPSTTTRQRVIMNDATAPGIGQLYSGRFPVPDYSGDALMISDVALGQPDVDTGWQRGRHRIALLPTSLLPGSAFDLYYEIYNLSNGTPYSTELTIHSIDDGAVDGPPIIGLQFAGESDTGPYGWVQELRRVETSLPEGSYRIIVTITDLRTDATTSRSRTFEVRGWPHGATLVAASPERRSGR